MEEEKIPLDSENLTDVERHSRSTYGLLLCLVLGATLVLVGIKATPQSSKAYSMNLPEKVLQKENPLDSDSFDYKSLPIDPNRHNRLARDFIGNREILHSTDLTCSKDDSGLSMSVPNLTLKAIVCGEPASVVINDCLIEEKQTVTIGSETPYDIEVIDIRETSVLLRCNKEIIELRLTDK